MADRRLSRGVTLHRFFLPASSSQTDRVTFPPEQSRQIRTVLRLRPGDCVVALDGAGQELLIRLDDVRLEVQGTVESRGRNQAEPDLSVVLYQGVLKAAKFEMVLQKCTEIGVAGFVPMSTSRSVPSEPGGPKLRRYETIVREAAEQSRRGKVPLVSDPVPYVEAVRNAVTRGQVVLLWEEEHHVHLDEVPRTPPGGRMSLFVGPEGGFTAEEVAQAREAGAHIASLGPRILRAETAAIAASALLLLHR